MTKLMTVEQYAADERNVCPCCHNDGDIEGDDIHIEGLTASQDVSCSECDSGWTDTYKRTGYDIEELGPGIDAPKLTPEQYAVAAPNICPCCGLETQIEGRDSTVEGRTLYQNVSCFECDSYWSDTYERSGYANLTNQNEGGQAKYALTFSVEAPSHAPQEAVAEAVDALLALGVADAVATAEDLPEGDASDSTQLAISMSIGNVVLERSGAGAGAKRFAHYRASVEVEADDGLDLAFLAETLDTVLAAGEAEAVESVADVEIEASPAMKLMAALEVSAASAVAVEEAD